MMYRLLYGGVLPTARAKVKVAGDEIDNTIDRVCQLNFDIGSASAIVIIIYFSDALSRSIVYLSILLLSVAWLAVFLYSCVHFFMVSGFVHRVVVQGVGFAQGFM